MVTAFIQIVEKHCKTSALISKDHISAFKKNYFLVRANSLIIIMNYKRFPLVYGVYKHEFSECEETEKLCWGVCNLWWNG